MKRPLHKQTKQTTFRTDAETMAHIEERADASKISVNEWMNRVAKAAIAQKQLNGKLVYTETWEIK
jgi:predicted HicB family RNase H-like nuclease